MTSELSAKTGYIISLADDFSKFNQAIFDQLYQPILGSQAFSLYHTMMTKKVEYPTISNRRAHSELLAWSNLDLSDFLVMRERLESVGLVESFEGADQLGEFVVYKLLPNMTTDEFLNDDLLSVLLLEAIGEASFNDLVKQATKYQLKTTDLKQTTKSFFDSFHIDEKSVNKLPNVIHESRQKFVVSDPDHTSTIKTDFDFQLLASLVENQGISNEQLRQNQELITTEHALYGLNEVQMAQVLGNAFNRLTNELEAQQIKILVSKQFQAQTVTKQDQPADINSNQASDVAGLSAEEKQLVKAAETYAPIDFLNSLKQQKNGKVTNGEEYILSDLINWHLLNNSVINILIYYLIQDRGDAVLKKNLVGTVANSWSQAHVTTPAQALKQIREYNQKRSRPAKSSNKKATVKKPVPNWAKDDYQPTTSQASPEEIDELKQKLAKIQKKQEQED